MAQEKGAALLFVGLPDGRRRQFEGVEGAQKTPIRLVTPPDVSRTPPTGGAQGVEPAVIADAGEGVAVDRGIGQLGQGGPGLKAARVSRRYG